MKCFCCGKEIRGEQFNAYPLGDASKDKVCKPCYDAKVGPARSDMFQRGKTREQVQRSYK